MSSFSLDIFDYLVGMYVEEIRSWGMFQDF